jgi:hypothetical protein
MVEILSMHVYIQKKLDLLKLFQEWGRGIKENDGQGEFN